METQPMTTQEPTIDLYEIYDFDEDFFTVCVMDDDENCIHAFSIDRPGDGTLSEFLADLAAYGTSGWDNAMDDPAAEYATLIVDPRGCTNAPRLIATAWPEDAENKAGYRVWEKRMSKFGRAWDGLED